MDIDDEHLRICLAVLEGARELEADDPRLRELEQASAHLRKSAKKTRKRARTAAKQASDLAKRSECGRWREWDAGAGGEAKSESEPQPQPREPRPRTLQRRQLCYVCKQPFHELHAHYHSLCPGCAARNWRARSQRVDLRGRRALVTGGRVKIGFELVLKLLRDGAEVLVLTRFPSDAARRFAAIEDFAELRARLSICALDLRHLPGVVEFCAQLREEGRPLDILINNAAQTIWRPPRWYRELAQAEAQALSPPEPLPLATASPTLALTTVSVGPDATAFLARFHQRCRHPEDAREHELFPAGAQDEEGRQLDLRARNSWVLGLEQVDARELVEAQLVNAIAPALLTSGLRPLLERSPAEDRHVVNVSAVEGQFAYANKTPRHPHTNMAKAALNMLTRTCADDWAAARIYINSVDTGWITQENPEAIKQRLATRGFRPPLDAIDGAARVYDPIVRGVEGQPTWGQFLKDYRPAPW